MGNERAGGCVRSVVSSSVAWLVASSVVISGGCRRVGTAEPSLERHGGPVASTRDERSAGPTFFVPQTIDAIQYSTCNANLAVGRRAYLVHQALHDESAGQHVRGAGTTWEVRPSETDAQPRYFGALARHLTPPVYVGASVRDAAEFERLLQRVSHPESAAQRSESVRHTVGTHAIDLRPEDAFSMIALRDSERGYGMSADFSSAAQWSREGVDRTASVAGSTLRYTKGSSPLRDDGEGGPPNPAHVLWYGFVELSAGTLLIRVAGDPFTEDDYLRFAREVTAAARLHPGVRCPSG